MSTIKRRLDDLEFRMASQKRGMLAMEPAEIRAGREKLLGNWPTGTPQEEIDQFEELRRRIWESV
jgi:hypothetical protein